jgi:hypothetical protein
MMGCTNRWLQLTEIAKLFGLSEDSIKRLAKNHGLPLRRVSPFATPGALEAELVEWLKSQPLVGPPVRPRRRQVRARR